jgi:hypothetical protein
MNSCKLLSIQVHIRYPTLFGQTIHKEVKFSSILYYHYSKLGNVSWRNPREVSKNGTSWFRRKTGILHLFRNFVAEK